MSDGLGEALAQQRFRELLDELGSEREYMRGWKTEVADLLSIDVSHLSRIINGRRKVGRETMLRAAAALGFDARFFRAAEGSYRDFAPQRTHAADVPETVGPLLDMIAERAEQPASPRPELLGLANRLLHLYRFGGGEAEEDTAELARVILATLGPIVRAADLYGEAPPQERELLRLIMVLGVRDLFRP